MNTVLTYLIEFALIWAALMLAWTLTRMTVRILRSARNPEKVAPGCQNPCSLRAVLVERVERVRRLKEMLCARRPAHLVEVFGLLA
jgi:hypothetical protein